MSIGFPATGALPQFAIPACELRRFTVAEYERLVETGVLAEDDRVELLDGWIATKMPINPPHEDIVDFLTRLLVPLAPQGWMIRIQNSLATAASVPEPDVVCVRGSRRDFRQRRPRGDEALFVIEVADSSVHRDREKAAIYAAAGVPLYWIVNIPDQTLEVYSDPTSAGYAANRILQGQEVADLPMPTGNLPIKVAELFDFEDD